MPPRCLDGLASVAAARHHPPCDADKVQTARLLGMAATLRSARETPLPPCDRPAHAGAALGDAAFSKAFDGGRAVPASQVLAEVPGVAACLAGFS